MILAQDDTGSYPGAAEVIVKALNFMIRAVQTIGRWMDDRESWQSVA